MLVISVPAEGVVAHPASQKLTALRRHVLVDDVGDLEVSLQESAFYRAFATCSQQANALNAVGKKSLAVLALRPSEACGQKYTPARRAPRVLRGVGE